MYSAYILDDDPQSLNGLLRDIAWLDHGFEVVGQTTSSAVALEEIATLQPRLVVSDLKSSAMDSMDFMEALKAQGIACHFLLISAHGTFEQARRFFLQGGFDYILRPMQAQEIPLVLERLFRQLAGAERKRTPAGGCSAAFLDLVEYINKNFTKKHNLVALGHQFGLNPNYICNLFSKHYGCTLTRYITDLRMEEAKRQIEAGARAFKVVAINCGYGDYYYFCRLFKEYYGVPPSKYLNNQE